MATTPQTPNSRLASDNARRAIWASYRYGVAAKLNRRLAAIQLMPTDVHGDRSPAPLRSSSRTSV